MIRQAVKFALDAPAAASPFDLWEEVYQRQTAWAAETSFPPLLWGFGVSMVERALVDAFCRATGRSFEQAVRDNSLGVRLDALHRELAGKEPAALLPDRANRTMIIRHTVGLADPLTDSDVPQEERLADGLPQSLEASVRFYGLTHLKIKLSGNTGADIERLQRIARIMESHAPDGYAHTLDGKRILHGSRPVFSASGRRFSPNLHSVRSLTVRFFVGAAVPSRRCARGVRASGPPTLA